MSTFITQRSGKYSQSQKAVLYTALIGASLLIFLPTTWMYQEMKSRLGVGIAEISMAVMVIIFLSVGFAGAGLAHLLDRAIQTRTGLFRSPQLGSWVDSLVRIWGFALMEERLDDPAPLPQNPTPNIAEIQAILEGPRKRGRKPTYSLDQWIPVVIRWESRDTLRETMTLNELLTEKFGENADGSPRMTEQSYYDWRRKVFAELENKIEQAKLPGEKTSTKP